MSTPETTTEAFADTRPSSGDDLPDYAPIPRAALGPVLNEQGTTSGALSGTSTGSPTGPINPRS
jgi:hypothetical protein